MSKFESLSKFEGISVDRNGFVNLDRVNDVLGQIDQKRNKEWVFGAHRVYTLRANELICIATWLNQLNGVTLDASMLA